MAKSTAQRVQSSLVAEVHVFAFAVAAELHLFLYMFMQRG